MEPCIDRMVSRESKSDIQNNIVKLLQKNKEAGFTEIKNTLNVSKPTLSHHLNILLDEKTIEFEKIGREKHYKLSGKISDVDSQTAILAMMFEEFLWDLDPKEYDFDDLLYKISDNVSAFFLYVILKSIKTGKNLFDAFESDEILRASTDFLTLRLFGKDVNVEKLRIHLGKREIDEYVTKIHQLSKSRKNNPLIDELFERLEEKHPQMIETLEDFYNHAFSEKSI